MKKLSAFISLILLLLFFSCFINQETYAQEVSPQPSISPATGSTGTSSDNGEDQSVFRTCPPQFDASASGGTKDPSCTSPYAYISDVVPTVKVTFPGLDPNGTYKICFRSDACIKSEFTLGVDQGKINDLLTVTGLRDDQTQYLKDGQILDSTGSVTVCGNGNADLYYGDDCPSDTTHFFHAGNFYLVTVFQNSQDNNWIAVARGGFYVSHGTPTVKVTPQSLGSGTKFAVSLTNTIKANGNKNGKDRNNYQIVLQGPGYKKEECDWISKDTPTRNFEFPLLPNSPVMHYADADKGDVLKNGFSVSGDYVFSINEQINEGGLHSDDCQGGFTYETITCKLEKNKATCLPPEVDPKGEDIGKIYSLLNQINGIKDGQSTLPCSDPASPQSDPTKCNKLNTAIGTIDLNVQSFVVSLLSLILSIAGIGAVLIIVYSGYRLLISRGNKEIIQDARDRLTAAIVGLLFIVFSLVILSVITGNILHIPGFS
jgi:hypothetical protein